MTQAAGQAAGKLQGAADAVLGLKHQARGGHAGSDREQGARARWHAGLPARNQNERDAHLSFEASLTNGLRQLAAQATQAGPEPNGHDGKPGTELEAGG